MSEHTEVRLPLIERLIELGWDKNQIQFEPEWKVPKTPSEASKRELGNSFKFYPVDIAIFDHPSHFGDYEHLQIIIETKSPKRTEGVNQLKIYMSLEPHVLLGIWTNGEEIVHVYKTSTSEYIVKSNKNIPKPTDNLIAANSNKIKWNDLIVPTSTELKAAFKRLLNIVVANDTKSTRRDDQLNSLCNVILAKLEGDKIAKFTPDNFVDFQVWDSEEATALRLKELFNGMRRAHRDLFFTDKDNEIELDDHTLNSCAYILGKYKLRDIQLDVVSQAFQIFRTSSLKSEEGQYYTPYPVIRSGVKLMEVKPSDTVIDPACGTGGFLLESYRQMIESHPNMSHSDGIGWANRNLYGVDRDRINVKLTKAIMITIGDGSTNTYLGDSIRKHLWAKSYPDLQSKLSPETFTCIITNPPFGKDLKVSKNDAKAAGLTITRKPKILISNGIKKVEFSKTVHEEREIGIIFLERCYELLAPGGRMGIILPETYMFSPSYYWFRYWLKDKFRLKAMLNIPMEAFQGFCRAKTNFYIFQKVEK